MIFASPKLILQITTWVLGLGVVVLVLIIITNNILALSYSPETVTKKFVSIIENPTQNITQEEKTQLQDITRSSFFDSWVNENNIKTLRTFTNNKPIKVGNIIMVGNQQNYATVQLEFENSSLNVNKATLYLQKYGSFFGGYKWYIYQIDMPQSNSLLDQIQQGIESLQNKLK